MSASVTIIHNRVIEVIGVRRAIFDVAESNFVRCHPAAPVVQPASVYVLPDRPEIKGAYDTQPSLNQREAENWQP